MQKEALLFVAGLLGSVAGASRADVTVVQDETAKVSGIYVGKQAAGSPAHFAARDLSYAIERMSGAKVEVKEVEEVSQIPAGPAIVLGDLAAQLGAQPKSTSLWKDSMRTVIGRGRILVGGESDMAVNCAVMDLLYEQGVRFFLPANIPGNIGEIMPQKKTLSWFDRDSERHPFIRARRVWGHNMGPGDPDAKAGSHPQWIRRTGGASPLDISVSHAWGGLIPQDVQQAKPDLFGIKAYDESGKPIRSGQFCVSNPEVVELVSQTLIERFRQDPARLSQSISPNDGGGQCICFKCQTLDPPNQGHGDWKGFQWFKVTVDVPAEGAANMMMWFGANDGTTRLWVNGKPVTFVTQEKGKDGKETISQGLEMNKGWRSFAVRVGQHLKPGTKNTFVVRLNHTLADLNLGGFLRPVMLYVPGDKELNEVKDTYQQMDL